MNKNVCLSIVIPIYNVESYLEKCIGSLLKTQGIEDTQIILVDDGSTDGSGELADRYAGSYDYIECFHKINGGLSDARNYGLSKASGDYVFFCDSDDLVDPDEFCKVIAAVKGKSSEVFIWNARTVDENGVLINSDYDCVMSHKGLQEKVATTGINAMVKQIEDHGKFSVMAWLMACQRVFLLNNNLVFESGIIHEDELWTPRVLIKASTIMFLPYDVYRYRLRENSITGSNNQELHAKSLVYVMNALSDLYITEISDKNSLNLIMSCWADEYLWVITEYEVYKYGFKNEIRIGEILRYGKGIKRRVKGAFLLLFGFRFYSIFVAFMRNASARKRHLSESVKAFARYIQSVRKFDAVLINTPVYGNIGDHAIAQEVHRLCSSLNVSVFDNIRGGRLLPLYALFTPKNKLIFINGGGNMGSLWPIEEIKIRKAIKYFKNNRIIIFPQTVYFDSDTEEGKLFFETSYSIYKSHPKLTLFARERITFEFIKTRMPEIDVKLVPDMAMLMSYDAIFKREGALVCLRHDKEKTLSEFDAKSILSMLENKYSRLKITDTCVKDLIFPEQRSKMIKDKLDEFASSKLVVTDRLHGMIFAAITGTPCIVTGSLSPKLKGCYEWIKECDYIEFSDDLGHLSELLEKLDSETGSYDLLKMREQFEPLVKCITACVNGNDE